MLGEGFAFLFLFSKGFRGRCGDFGGGLRVVDFWVGEGWSDWFFSFRRREDRGVIDSYMNTVSTSGIEIDRLRLMRVRSISR